MPVKLMRVGAPGVERPAMMGADGQIRDLSSVVRDFNAEALSRAGLARLAALDPCQPARHRRRAGGSGRRCLVRSTTSASA